VTYVAAAYLVCLGVLAFYVWTIWARHRELMRSAAGRR